MLTISSVEGNVGNKNASSLSLLTHYFYFYFASEGCMTARCVQVDMEEKVISSVRRNTCPEKWSYSSNSYFTSKCGSGNNWAYGYFVHGNEFEDQIQCLIQSQLEMCDSLDGFLVTMSLAGGTGSGVGTKLLTHLSDIVPKACVLTQLIWPFTRGEVSVQAYNAILTLGHLLSPSTANSLDGFIMHHNDTLHKICSNRLLASDPKCQIGMDHLNALLTHQLAGILQPTINDTRPECFEDKKRLTTYLLDLCGHPDFRITRLRCLPYMPVENRKFCTETWSQLARHAKQMLLTGSAVEDKLDWSVSASSIESKSRIKNSHLPLLSYLSVLRGDGAIDHVRDSNTFIHSLTSDLLISGASPAPVPSSFRSVIRGHPRYFGDYPRSLFVASNGGGQRMEIISNADTNRKQFLMSAASSGDTSASLKYVSLRAWELFASRAYVHQYEKYGLTTDVFMDCVATVEQIAHSYSTIPWQ
ncbi:Tubulin delta chain [Schistosoma japonicum]|nr:Tubulin delta chain [Schistosoma japonicum]